MIFYIMCISDKKRIRALFALLLQIVKPFPSNGTLPDSKEAKVAELVLKCVWKLARNIPQDLAESQLDPVELFPAIEHFLQSVPPNEWRARATNRVPCGDMPLRTIKVIIQHVVGKQLVHFRAISLNDHGVGIQLIMATMCTNSFQLLLMTHLRPSYIHMFTGF